MRMGKKIVTLILGWILFSMTGTISMIFSFPLPQFMYTHRSQMEFTGPTDRNLLSKNINEPSVKAGTFNKLNLFDNGNLSNGIYFDEKEKVFRFGTVDGAFWMDEVSEDHGWLSEEEQTIGIDCGYYWLFVNDDWPTIMSERETSLFAGGWRASFEEDEQIKEENVAKVLEQQSNGKISLGQLAGLLNLHCPIENVLLGWYPREHKAVLRMGISEYVVIETDTLEKKQYFIPEYQYAHALSSDELLAYDSLNHSVIRYTLSSGESTCLAENFEDMKALNYIWRDGELVLGGLITENKAFLYNTSEDEPDIFELGSEFVADGFGFGEENFVITYRHADGQVQYKRGKY